MRRRNWYNATGLPGFMRFGYSPGGLGRGFYGRGPCAQLYMNDLIEANNQINPMNSDAQLTFLKNQSKFIEKTLGDIKAKIEELEQDKH